MTCCPLPPFTAIPVRGFSAAPPQNVNAFSIVPAATVTNDTSGSAVLSAASRALGEVAHAVNELWAQARRLADAAAASSISGDEALALDGVGAADLQSFQEALAELQYMSGERQCC